MILFSVNRIDATAEKNLNAVVSACKQMSGGKYTSGFGCYEGDIETCFMTNQNEIAISLAKKYNQDCYFERGHYGYWYLIETSTGDILDIFKGIVEKAASWPNENIGKPYTLMGGKVYVAEK
ncbi:MAG: hypothetical protein GTO02_14225 [Candidatus Dadabacteria bacterium]|nr:hypothetical protein [Candidatus Dadabacteria bacterium]